MSSPASLARRGLRATFGWWWRQARPSAGADLRGSGAARPAHETGRPPTPGERWLPTTPASGPWAHVDPHAAGRWPRRASLVVVAGWGALVWLRVRRDLRRPMRGERALGANVQDPAERHG